MKNPWRGLLLLLLCPPSENGGAAEHGDGPGVCRPVIGLPVLWLKKFKSLFSSCSYSHEVLLAHCYSARVTERETERGRHRMGGWLWFSNGRELLVVLGGGLCRWCTGLFFFCRAWRHVCNRLSNEERYWTAPNIWPRFLGVKRGREREKVWERGEEKKESEGHVKKGWRGVEI